LFSIAASSHAVIFNLQFQAVSPGSTVLTPTGIAMGPPFALAGVEAPVEIQTGQINVNPTGPHPNPIPEADGMLLFASGLLLVGLAARRRS
jgi:hypothetical protein